MPDLAEPTSAPEVEQPTIEQPDENPDETPIEQPIEELTEPEIEEPIEPVEEPVMGESAQEFDQEFDQESFDQESSEAVLIPPLTNPVSLSPRPASTKINSRPLVYVGIGLLLTLLAVAVGAIFLYAVFALVFFGGEGDDIAAAPIATEEAVVAAPPPPTPTITPTTDPGAGRSLAQQVSEAPTATRAPVSPPPAPAARPQLLADSNIDFSSSQGNWQYLWASPGTNTWQPMVYESREYGTCWYAADYVRICEESGHPGDEADIAWRWTSPVPGPIEILLHAEKIDVGGDGVIVSVFNNTGDISTDPVFSRPVLGNDESGFANRFIIDTIQPGDFLLFVMQKNEDVTFDHTDFEATICQISCP
ncbi:MAG: hypothetical protein H6631_01035 [Anaerolineaceae bacterium]|nr:hypothetical protein [Anaerolineaceae bacterium]MCB9098116.1 hypothetical protein [Anaerolineales bacterium]